MNITLSRILGWTVAFLMTGLTARAEYFPNEEGDTRYNSSYSGGGRRRRESETSGEVSGFNRQRAAVEQYLNENRGGRDTQLKNFERKWGRDTDRDALPMRAPRPSRQVTNESAPRYNRYWENGDRRYVRSYDGGVPDYGPAPEPRPRVSYDNAPSYNAYGGQPRNSSRSLSPNYPFDNAAKDFASAFDPAANGYKKPSESRQALLKVKNWMRGDNEQAVTRGRFEEEPDETENPALDSRLSGRVGLLGGISKLAGTEADIPSNFYLGVMADASFSHFFGAQLDGFYGVAPSLTEETVDKDGNVSGSSSRSNQHKGVMADVFAKYPVPFSSFLLVPRLGLGFGYLGVTAKSNDDSFTQTTNGVYWNLGTDIVVSDSVTLGIDYASALSAAGGFSQITGGNEETGPIEGAGFSRFRVGAYVKVYKNLSLGAQYIQRKMTSSQAAVSQSGGAQKPNESLSQFLGVLMYQL